MEVLHITHFLNKFVLVSLSCHDCSKIFVGEVICTLTLYLCIVGKDLGTKISRSVTGSFKRGPNFIKACLADLNLYFLARVFAKDSLKIHISFGVSIRLAAKE
jgi:hypothetical protein